MFASLLVLMAVARRGTCGATDRRCGRGACFGAESLDPHQPAAVPERQPLADEDQGLGFLAQGVHELVTAGRALALPVAALAVLAGLGPVRVMQGRLPWRQGERELVPRPVRDRLWWGGLCTSAGVPWSYVTVT
jgi:hypothetical protein